MNKKFISMVELQDKSPDELICKLRSTYKNIELDILTEKFPLVDAVGAASAHLYTPRVVLINKSKIPNARTILIGKGITYDSGGYALKPCACMTAMHFDKTGALLVADVAYRTKTPGLIFLTPNLIGSNGTVNGTIIKSYSGLNVEIINTDAEGRLGLADLLSYSKKNFPQLQTICIATLTGAAVFFAGQNNFALATSKDISIQKRIMKEFYENKKFNIYPAPALDFYKKVMKSDNNRADVQNLSNLESSGSMTAHGFLRYFDDNTILIDIAAMMEDGNRNSTGWGPKQITRLLEIYK